MIVTENGYIDGTGLKKALCDEIVCLAKKYGVEKIWLFGSRARNDFKRKSDIDIAFFGGRANEFIIDVNEETRTLLKFDIVNLNGTVSPELRDEIRKDGILLYEKD